MNKPDRYLTFRLDERIFAIPVTVIERIIHAVEITSLPDTSDLIPGVINMEGETLCVIDIRSSLNIPKHAVRSSDRFIIINTERRRFALITDSIEDILKTEDEDIVQSEMIWDGLKRITGTIRLDGNIIPILSIEQFFSQQCAEKDCEIVHQFSGESEA